MDGIARAVGERVLAACGAARGCFGRVRGAARLHVSAPCRKAAPSMHSASAVLALCATDAHEVISSNFSDVMGTRDHGLSGHAAWECKEGRNARHARRRSGREGRRLLTL